jgi:hypothetical protein
MQEDGVLFEQTASVQLNGRADVQQLERKLQEALDMVRGSVGVRGKPICPDREQLFSESFDELIRQISLEQPERGLLLLRIRKFSLLEKGREVVRACRVKQAGAVTRLERFLSGV